MGIVESKYKFTYDNNMSYEENFSYWAQLNHEERLAWGDKQLTDKEQKETFVKLFKDNA